MAIRFKRHNREVQAAVNLQQQILPTSRELPCGLRGGWIFKPLRTLSGDLCTWRMLDQHLLAWYLLDVSGHGTAAAIRGAQISTALRPPPHRALSAEELARYGDPLAMIQELNERFRLSLEVPLFFTITYAVVDLRSLIMRQVCAGHTETLIRHDDGTVEALTLGGPALGTFPSEQTTWTVEEIELARGDRLIACSDGIIEAHKGTDLKDYGSDRWSAAVAAQGAETDFQAFLEQLLADVDDFLDQQAYADDVTILGLDFTAWQAP